MIVTWARTYRLVLWHQLKTLKSPKDMVGGKLVRVVARRVR